MTSESTFGVVGQPFTSCTQVPEQPNTNLINVKCTQLILCNRENYVCWPDKQSHAEDVHGSERKDSKQDHQKRSVQRERIDVFFYIDDRKPNERLSGQFKDIHFDSNCCFLYHDIDRVTQREKVVQMPVVNKVSFRNAIFNVNMYDFLGEKS